MSRARAWFRAHPWVLVLLWVVVGVNAVRALFDHHSWVVLAGSVLVLFGVVPAAAGLVLDRVRAGSGHR